MIQLTYQDTLIMNRTFLTCTALALALTACTSEREVTKMKLENDTQYWQRVDTTSSLYLRGAKAQQMLNRDIARCTVEVNELVNQGLVREAIPSNTVNGKMPDPDSALGKMAKWESPEREGHLLHEVIEYHDFESCMVHKGWARVEYLPYEQAVRARDEYLDAIGKQQYTSTYTVKKDPVVEKSFDDLNGDIE
tara:strand:- start:1296 stop:1874 length:579 start_codon:yes stop_codon:yes gene_type:complete